MDTRMKVRNIFSYLLNIKKINENIIRNVTQYEKIYWEADFSELQDCIVNKEEGNDEWLVVLKQNISEPPEPSKALKQYIVGKYNNPLSIPTHVEKIYNEHEKIEICFTEDKQVLELWEKWIERWKQWSIEITPAWKTQKIYNQLFQIYLTLEKNSENLEIIWGHGLLVWKVQGQSIMHAIFTTKMELNFDAKNGKFILKPQSNGTNMEIYMLDGLDIPNMHSIIELSQNIREMGINPRNAENIDIILEQIIHYLSSNGDFTGEFNEKLIKFNEITFKKYPAVYNSPLIALRRNDAKVWISEISNIIEKVDGDYKIPPTIKALTQDAVIKQDVENSYEWKNIGEDLLFPLPANEEQKEIVRKLASNYGVVVQGPPGTGKSHTIVNLICHLLANGKRVLVTSQTGRALRVLADKIPKEIRTLCISYVGNDTKALRELDESITKIADNLSIEPDLLMRDISELKEELDLSRRSQAFLFNELKKIQLIENESIKLSGEEITLMEMSKWVRDNEENCSWIQDEIELDTEMPVSEEDFVKLIKLLDGTKKSDINRLNHINSIIYEMPSYDEVEKKITEYSKLVDEYEISIENLKGFNNYEIFTGDYDKIKDMLLNSKNSLKAFEENWLSNVVKYYYSSELTKPLWKQFVKNCKECFRKITEISEELSIHDVKLPSDIDIISFEEDFKIVNNELKNKKKLGAMFKIFHSKCKYVFEECFVDDKPLNTLEQCKIMKLYIEQEKIYRSIKVLWNNTVRDYGGEEIKILNIDSLLIIQEYVNDIEEIISLEKSCRESIQPYFNNMGISHKINWYSSETYEYLFECVNDMEKVSHCNEIKKYLNDLKHLLEKSKEGFKDLIEALDNVDLYAVKDCFNEIERLRLLRSDVNFINKYLNEINSSVPKLVQDLIQQANSGMLYANYKNFSMAWKWSQYNTYLSEIEDMRSDKIENKLEEEKQKEKRIISELVYKKTWYNQILRTTEQERRSLFAWLELIKKIGKGTGKYASQYRKLAQKEMETCKDVIPVWIMPVNKIAEIIKPTENLFDVIIFDESSQSDIFALSALFRAKKAVIVGDDKQISPQAVGKNQTIVQDLIQRYLKDIPHSELFDMQASLYSTALRVFPNRIMLKEHFRCVPEIIQFSNDLCYGGEIIPLKLPLENEKIKPPVVAVKVEDGYRDELKAINQPEAEAIVEQIVKCSKDEIYKGMTMGVISLLGEMQAQIIENLLRDKLGEQEMIDRKILCGDAYSFQGDERDVMFLSMVIANNVRFTSLTKADDIRRFNVAASRAKNQMWLFYSVDLKDINSNCIRAKFLSYCMNPSRAINEKKDLEDKLESQFEIDVYRIIKSKGYRVTPQVKVGRYRIDMVVENLNNRLAVECDGDRWHGIDRWEYDYERQKDLERVGWKFFRVRGSDFYRNQERAMEKLWDMLDGMKV